MSRPTDSFYRRIDIRRRYTDIDVVDVALQRLAAQIERGITAVQSSVPVAITDYLFGASDGIEDVTFALQVAINKVGENGGGQVFLPKGDYTISDQIVFNHNNVVLVGEGYGTRLLFTTTGGTAFIFADTRERVGLKNLRIENESSTAGTFAVNWVDCEESFIQEVFFLNCNNCIDLASCDTIDISRNADSNTATVTVRLTDTGVGTTDSILVQLNDFEAGIPSLTYGTVITGAPAPRNVLIEQNTPLPINTVTIAGANITMTRDTILGKGRYIILTAAGAASVDTIEVTFPGDWRVFQMVAANNVTLNDGAGNLLLAGAFTGNAAGNAEDTITMFCDGTSWIETSRSLN